MKMISAKPDVLDLVVGPEGLARMESKPFGHGFGSDCGRMGVRDGVPLGVINDLFPYHAAYPSIAPGDTLLLLAPAHGVHSRFPFPEMYRFITALNGLLTEDPGQWTLVCEEDCDQETVPRLDAGSPAAKEALEKLFTYLRGEPGSRCPTFAIVKA